MRHGWSLSHVHQPSNSWLPEIAQRVASLLNIQRGFIEEINKKHNYDKNMGLFKLFA